jgi:hypothetical protein
MGPPKRPGREETMSKHPRHQHYSRSEKSTHIQEGLGGSRHGYRSSNEIEDMEIFDDEPGKDPSEDGMHDANSIDANGYRERK